MTYNLRVFIIKITNWIIHYKIKRIIQALSKELAVDGIYKSSSNNIFATILTCRILAESVELLDVCVTRRLKNEISALIEKSSPAIIREKSSSDSWNYWQRDSPEYTSKPYPDDLDDTFNAHLLFQIFPHFRDSHTQEKYADNPDRHTAKAMSLYNLTNQLLNAERKVYHPKTSGQCAYNTWLDTCKNTDFEDIDPVVQVIVYKVSSRLKSVPHKFKEFLTSRLSNFGHSGLSLDSNLSFLESKYYDSKLYVLSELSYLSLEDTIDIPSDAISKNHYRKKCENKAGYIDTILRAQICLNLDFLSNVSCNTISMRDIAKVYTYLCIPVSKVQAEPIFIESISKGNKTYCYSKSVVLALYLKLLASTHSRFNSILKKEKRDAYKLNREKSFTGVYGKLQLKFSDYSTQNCSIETLIDSIFKNKNPLKIVHNELYDFAYNLKSSANVKHKIKKNLDSITLTYEAVLLGWVSYTANDAIMDKEIPCTLLPFANICNTHMHDILFNILHLPDYIHQIILEVLNEVNLALHGEAQIGVVPNTILNTTSHDHSHNQPHILEVGKNLQSSKSIAHCIGPICIFTLIAHNWCKDDVSDLIEYYRYYLSLKQLSDDVHDWQDDIAAGRSTYITSLLVSTASKSLSPTEYIDTFSNTVIYAVYNEMEIQTQKSLEALSKIEKYFNPEYIQNRIRKTKKYLLGIEQAIQEIEVYNLFRGDIEGTTKK